MPTYTYFCDSCKCQFELTCSIGEYKESVRCQKCKKQTSRLYSADLASLNTSVRKNDGELKTIGDLALRNTEKLSSDQKQDLHNKHNSYKDQSSTKKLPKGMSRMVKPPKPRWH